MEVMLMLQTMILKFTFMRHYACPGMNGNEGSNHSNETCLWEISPAMK